MKIPMFVNRYLARKHQSMHRAMVVADTISEIGPILARSSLGKLTFTKVSEPPEPVLRHDPQSCPNCNTLDRAVPVLGSKSGLSSNRDTSMPEEAQVFYLTFTGSSEGIAVALTESQEEFLLQSLRVGTRVSCSLVTQLGIPVVAGMSLTLTPKAVIPPISFDSPTRKASGRAGEHDNLDGPCACGGWHTPAAPKPSPAPSHEAREEMADGSQGCYHEFRLEINGLPDAGGRPLVCYKCGQGQYYTFSRRRGAFQSSQEGAQD